MLTIGGAHPVEVGPTLVIFFDPFFGKGAILNLGQQLTHGLLGLLGHDARPSMVIAELGRIAHRVAHVVETALVEEIDDQLELVHALKVRDLGLIPCFDQRFKAGFDQRRDATTEHRLLAKQIGLGLFRKRRLDHTRAGTANALRIG